MLMLLYPLEGEIEGYSREQFLDDLCDEVEKDIRQAFAAGAERVSIDFTEGRLANKNDSRNPWTGKDMLQEFIDLNNRVLDRFSADERKNIGIHTCPGGDMDSVHSKEVPYEKLLSKMFQLNAGYFLIQCASEDDRENVYKLVGQYSRDDADGVPQVCFIGVINPLDPEVETPEQVRDALVAAAKHIPVERLGATDDCGFSPFSRDEKPKHGSPDFARDIAMQKIANRGQGRADGLRGAGRLSEPPDTSLAASSAFVQGAGLVVDAFSGSEVTGHIDAGPRTTRRGAWSTAASTPPPWRPPARSARRRRSTRPASSRSASPTRRTSCARTARAGSTSGRCRSTRGGPASSGTATSRARTASSSRRAACGCRTCRGPRPAPWSGAPPRARARSGGS